MSKYSFNGVNHGGAIIGVDIVFRNAFKDNKPKKLDKVLAWLLNRRIKQGNIKCVIISTERKRRKKALDKAVNQA